MSKHAKALERAMYLNKLIDDAENQNVLDSWNEFVEALEVPGEMYPALATSRSELLALMQPRALTADECKVMFRLIGGLIRTNMALRQHSEQVAHMTDTWADAFKHLQSVGLRIEKFANFKRENYDDDDNSE